MLNIWRRGVSRCAPMVVLAVILSASLLHAQDYGARLGQVKRGGRLSFEPTGPGVLMDALDPVVRKWYVPQELYSEYRWKQQEYNNYARTLYQRYVNTALEGEYFYDIYGNYLMRGWLIYDWRQENPQPFGSAVEKSGRFSSWFSNLVIASDHKGQYHYAITVSNQLRTTLTPMTFSKPLFDGLQWDFASDKYTATLLLSRISDAGVSGANPQQRTDNTNLIGGRLVAQVGDFVRVGTTFVSAHQAHTQVEAFSGDMFKGNLTAQQNAEGMARLQIAIRDDSPEDTAGGGALFASDLVLYDLTGQQFRASELGFRPLVEGGFERQGFLAADGNERIVVTYDFGDRSYTGPDLSELERVEVELVVADDYRIEVASDLQPVYQVVARAPGNVQDNSNQQVLRFDYGLRTADQITGFTLELDDLAGFKGYMEIDINHQFRQYPNPNLDQHHVASTRANAWLLNLSQTHYPYFAFGEGFDISPDYSTSMTVVDSDGELDESNDFQRFEMVDDNDDQDRRPDWRRKGWEAGDQEVFPGWDENNDFISDFNQNDNIDSPNLIPDYEEPFLRFQVDRPDFLYGVDMNHNGWVDRFENDEEPDYPYRRNQRGYNIYGGAFLGQEVRFAVGQQRLRQISTGRRNLATYLLFTADQRRSWGRLQLFQDLRKVHDTIQDDLLQWVQPANTRGGLRLVTDPMPAPHTWVNTTWLGGEYTRIPGLSLSTKFKWQIYHQLGDGLALELAGRRRDAVFLGLIDKVEYRFNLGQLTLVPRWKSELLHQSQVSRTEPHKRQWDQLYVIMARFPVFRSSFIEGGVEYESFAQLRTPPPPGAEASFKGLVGTWQLTNLSEYQGYRLTTTIGFELARRHFEFHQVQTRTRGFVTVYAGVQ